MEFTAQLPVIGLDLAKSVFQLHIGDTDSGEIQRRQIKRAKLTDFFAKCQKSLVAMEACSSSHYWARTLMSLGHQVKMLPAQHVKAFLLRDKTDAMDAQAIWVAAQQPHILPVPVKTERQQASMALHCLSDTTSFSSRSKASWPRHSRLTCWRPTWWSVFRSSSNALMGCRMTSTTLASGCVP